jgi:hypothetical protein
LVILQHSWSHLGRIHAWISQPFYCKSSLLVFTFLWLFSLYIGFVCFFFSLFIVFIYVVALYLRYLSYNLIGLYLYAVSCLVYQFCNIACCISHMLFVLWYLKNSNMYKRHYTLSSLLYYLVNKIFLHSWAHWHPHNPSIQETEAGGWRIHQPSLGYLVKEKNFVLLCSEYMWYTSVLYCYQTQPISYIQIILSWVVL